MRVPLAKVEKSRIFTPQLAIVFFYTIAAAGCVFLHILYVKNVITCLFLKFFMINTLVAKKQHGRNCCNAVTNNYYYR